MPPRPRPHRVGARSPRWHATHMATPAQRNGNEAAERGEPRRRARASVGLQDTLPRGPFQ